MNIFTFTGFLGKDSEVKSTQSGSTLCEFSVAVTSGYKDKEVTTWTSCVIFGKRAEGKLPGYLVKGQQVAISGELTQETWEKPNGGTGFKLKVVVNSLDLIGAKEQKQQSAPQQQQAPASASQQAHMRQQNDEYGQRNPEQQAPSQDDSFDDSIPFSNPYKNMEYLV